MTTATISLERLRPGVVDVYRKLGAFGTRVGVSLMRGLGHAAAKTGKLSYEHRSGLTVGVAALLGAGAAALAAKGVLVGGLYDCWKGLVDGGGGDSLAALNQPLESVADSSLALVPPAALLGVAGVSMGDSARRDRQDKVEQRLEAFLNPVSIDEFGAAVYKSQYAIIGRRAARDYLAELEYLTGPFLPAA